MAPESALPRPAAAATDLASSYRRIRAASLGLAADFSAEWLQVQAHDLASPGKWHLAHTTWFFERLVLRAHEPRYRPFRRADGGEFPADRLFNSYYQAVGPQLPQPTRALLASPDLAEILAYRAHVDAAMQALLAVAPSGEARELVVLGLAHEEQHQELLITDLLAALRAHPEQPAWPGLAAASSAVETPADLTWLPVPRGVVAIGAGEAGFAYDNERPRHRVYLEPAELADRLVTCGEYAEFVAAGGYRDPQWWCDDGWQCCQQAGWAAPADWWRDGTGGWQQTSAAGRHALERQRPVTHLSWYEADAYARWRGARLPTEAEWEATAAAHGTTRGALLEDGGLRPAPAGAGPGLRQALGDCWEWTGSAYRPYPGFRPLAGAAGEYNGKFMINKMVLRGGSCLTPGDHLRISYRNFFPPETRWQCSGIRLARDPA